MLKDRLEDDEDLKNDFIAKIWEKNQVDVTGSEENKMTARSAPCKDISMDIFKYLYL